MKHLLIKLLTVPAVSYFLMMPIIIILQNIFGRSWIKDTLDGSVLPIWLVLTPVLIVVIIAHHLIKRKQ